MNFRISHGTVPISLPVYAVISQDGEISKDSCDTSIVCDNLISALPDNNLTSVIILFQVVPGSLFYANTGLVPPESSTQASHG